MRIKILQPIAGIDFDCKPGDVVELLDAEASRWIAGGIAERTADAAQPTVNWPRHVSAERRAIVDGLVSDQLEDEALDKALADWHARNPTPATETAQTPAPETTTTPAAETSQPPAPAQAVTNKNKRRR